MDHLGVIFGPFLGVDPGSLWDHLGIVWGRCGTSLGPFGVFLTLFGGFGAFLGQKPVILGFFLVKNCIETLKPYFEEDTQSY